jgi:transposase
MSTMKRPSNDKQKRLKEQGALNPHPEKVKDELFGDSGLDFFDPHDLVQVKYEMLRSVEKEGRSVTEASKRFGFSRPAFYQVQSQFKEGGITGFIRERPGPKSAHKVTPDVVQFIENRIKEGEPLRARALVPLIKKEFNKKVHPRSIERAIARSKKKGAKKND